MQGERGDGDRKGGPRIEDEEEGGKEEEGRRRRRKRRERIKPLPIWFLLIKSKINPTIVSTLQLCF